MEHFNQRARVIVVVSILAICSCILIARTAYLALGPNRDRAHLLVMTREPLSLRLLTEHAEELRRMTADIDSASLGEIRATTERTVTLVDRANREIETQVQAWEVTRGRMREDGNVYADLRAQLVETQKLQDEQVVRLQKALDNAYSWQDRTVTLISTLLLGALGSMLAAALFPARSIRALRRLIAARRRPAEG